MLQSKPTDYMKLNNLDCKTINLNSSILNTSI